VVRAAPEFDSMTGDLAWERGLRLSMMIRTF